MGVALSISLLLAFLLMAVCPIALRIRLGHGWLWRPYSLLISAALIYHLGSESLLMVASIRHDSTFRAHMEQSDVDRGALVVAVAMVVATLAYVLVARPAAPAANTDIPQALHALDWRITGILSIPLLISTVHAEGYATGVPLDSRVSSSTVEFSQQFMIILLVLTSFGLLVEFGLRWFVPVTLGQSFLLSLAGQRLEILVGVGMLLVLLWRVNLRPNYRALAATALVGVALTLALTSVRSEVGRQIFYSDSGVSARVEALFKGVAAGIDGQVGDEPSLAAQFADRMDGNAYVGAVEASFRQGAEPQGWAVVLGSVTAAAPSFIFGGKLAVPVEQLNPEYGAIVYLNIADVDYLPGFFGLYVESVGTVALLTLMFAFGLAIASLERWVFARLTALRLITLAALVQGALFYERGIPSMLIILRGVVLLSIVLGLLAILKVKRARRNPRSIAVPTDFTRTPQSSGDSLA